MTTAFARMPTPCTNPGVSGKEVREIPTKRRLPLEAVGLAIENNLTWLEFFFFKELLGVKQTDINHRYGPWELNEQVLS